MQEFHKNQIGFTVIKLENICDRMIKVMQENHPDLVVTDLVNAQKTKSSEEVTKMFVESASFILRATVQGKGKKNLAKKEPLWDINKI
jgi:hypothetical protein